MHVINIKKNAVFELYFVFVLYMYESKDPLDTMKMLHTSSLQRRYVSKNITAQHHKVYGPRARASPASLRCGH